MLKLANQVIDAYDDVSKTTLRKLAKLNPDVNFMTPEERANLHDTDFALSVITKKASKFNKFPIADKDSTWLSNQFFAETCEKLGAAASIAAYHIKKACERFDVEPTPAVMGLAKEASSNVYFEGESTKQVKVAEYSLEKFAEVENIGGNYTFAQYVFARPEHVKMAAAYFDQYSSKMPLESRHKYAAAIQRRAHELGMKPQGGIVSKYASDHYSGQVDAHIRSRASLLEVADPAIKTALEKLASMKKELSPSDFAQALHGIDKRAKLDRYYGGYLTNPYEATFAKEPDSYAGYRHKTASLDLSSDDIKKAVIEKYAKIKEYFGHSLADELKKEPVAIFDSLPNDAKEIFAGLISGTL